LKIYLTLKKKYKPTHIAVAFDRHEPTFRHELFKEYKGKREPMPNDFAEQLPFLKNILIYLGVKLIDCPHYEADDILGTISKACEDSNLPCYIVSGDKDVFQLIDDNTTVIYLKNNNQVLYDTETFVKEFGFQPINLIDFKAIVGDSSDNYIGIKGLGEKTVTPVITEYGSIENIYANIDNLTLKKGQIQKLIEGEEDAKFCKKLATICREAPIDIQLEHYKYIGFADEKELYDVLEFLEMKKIMKSLGFNVEEQENNVDTPEVESTILSKDFTTTSPYTDYLISDDTLYINDNGNIYESSNPSIIVNYLNSDIPKRTIGVKAHYSYTDDIKNITMDAELGGYLMDTNSKEYTVESLCKAYELEYFKGLKGLASIYSLPQLNDYLTSKVQESQMETLLTLEIKLSKVLASMETIGVKVDVETVKEYQTKLGEILDRLETEIYSQAGHEFKILSPRQLGEVLFKELQLPTGKETKTGYSTSNEVLEKIKDKHPIVPLVMEYRFYHKLKSTYLDGLLDCVSNDGRIHTIFRQTETRTGRLSSAEPNLQNIPIRNDFAKNIRKFFVTDDDKVLIDADYNQIELRITAVMSHDTNMVENFLNDKDIHMATAMKIFNRTEDEITPQMRAVAKSINFGLIYGMGASKLSKEINITPTDAKKYITNYFETYPNVKTFMDDIVERCKVDGYVKTILNRVRYVPEITSSNRMVQSSGERIAMNTPIQGSSADIIKLAMVNVYERLQRENLNARLILQVHDELLVESEKSCADTVAKIVQEEMEHVMDLEVPLTAEVKLGGSWFDAH
jgi:DNA polymerase-1